MKEEYDFSNSRPNPYTRKAKKQITINLDNDTVVYFKSMAEKTGIPYQTLINLYLTECATQSRELQMAWR